MREIDGIGFRGLAIAYDSNDSAPPNGWIFLDSRRGSINLSRIQLAVSTETSRDRNAADRPDVGHDAFDNMLFLRFDFVLGEGVLEDEQFPGDGVPVLL
jgi:hypothetical protein